MATVRELACACGAVLAATAEGTDQPAVRCPVCGDLADVELSSRLVGTIGTFDPAGPTIQVLMAPPRTDGRGTSAATATPEQYLRGHGKASVGFGHRCEGRGTGAADRIRGRLLLVRVCVHSRTHACMTPCQPHSAPEKTPSEAAAGPAIVLLWRALVGRAREPGR